MGIGTQLKYLALNVCVLAELAGVVAYVNHLVRFKSGIDSNDTLRRVWSKPEVVAFQPVLLPLSLSLIICFGMNVLARGIMVGVLEILDTLHTTTDGKMNAASEFAATIVGTICGALAGTLTYKLNGGTFMPYFIVLSLIVQVCGTALHLFGNMTLTLVVVWLLLVTFTHVLVSYYAMRLIPDRPNVAEVPVSGPNVGLSKRFWIIVFACVLLYIQRLADFFGKARIFNTEEQDVYLAQVLRDFSSLLVLALCVFLSILSTNYSLVRNRYSWQWQSVLTPTLVVLPLEIFLAFQIPQDYFSTVRAFVYQFMKQLFMYSASGYLGSTVYLTVLARAASIALDPGFEGQSELILDEDDSDYEV